MDVYFNAAFLIAFLCTYFYFIFSKKVHISQKIILLIGAFYMSLFPFILSKKVSAFLGDYYSYYSNTINTIFIGIIILFCLVVITKIIRVYKSNKKFSIILIAISTALALFSLYEGLKVPAIKEINIYDKNITQPKKIVFLSDIHISKNLNLKKIAGLVDDVNKQNPDAIVLGGDVIDDTPQNNKPYLEVLKNLKAKNGIYFATGNHEVYRGTISSIGQLYQQGFQYLFNSGINLGGGIYLAAIPDVRTQSKQVFLEQSLKQSPKDSYKILISHTPFNFGADNNFDLMLSGHTHGGQIFPFHILAKNQHKYLAGFYDMDNGAKIYVSRGSGQWGPQLRFLAPAEITVINLLPIKK